MFYSTLKAITIALSLQNVSFTEMLRFLVIGGYVSPLENSVAILFSDGGWISIMSSILIVFFSSAFVGIFEGAKLLAEVERGVGQLFQRIGAI